MQKAGFPRTPSAKNSNIASGLSKVDAYAARYERKTHTVPIPVAAGLPAGRIDRRRDVSRDRWTLQNRGVPTSSEGRSGCARHVFIEPSFQEPRAC